MVMLAGVVIWRSESTSAIVGVQGQVVVDPNRCWTFVRNPSHTVVWPDETEWADATHQAVRLENGLIITSGSFIEADGVVEHGARNSWRSEGRFPAWVTARRSP